MIRDSSPLLHAHLPVVELTEGLTLAGEEWGCSLEERRLVSDVNHLGQVWEWAEGLLEKELGKDVGRPIWLVPVEWARV